MSSKDAPQVSVLIRSMDRPLLSRALASIAAQTYDSLDVIVVAACGSAHAPLPPQCGRFPLRLIGNGRRLGRADAANFLLASAESDICIFLDDDDTHDPSHIHGLVESLLAAPSARLAYSAIRVMNLDGVERTVISHEFDRLALHEQNYIQLGASLFSRSLYTGDNCRFDPNVGSFDDWDFWLQCSQHTDFTFKKRATTNWYAESGESGAGMGANFDPAVNLTSRELVERKWRTVRDELERKLQLHVTNGYSALAEKVFANAESHFRHALSIRSGHPDVLNALARLLYARGAFDDARKCVLRATDAPGDQSDNLCNLAMIEMAVGKFDLARRLLQHALRDRPGHTRAQSLLTQLGSPT